MFAKINRNNLKAFKSKNSKCILNLSTWNTFCNFVASYFLNTAPNFPLLLVSIIETLSAGLTFLPSVSLETNKYKNIAGIVPIRHRCIHRKTSGITTCFP